MLAAFKWKKNTKIGAHLRMTSSNNRQKLTNNDRFHEIAISNSV